MKKIDNYYNLINERLPKQIQGLQYLLAAREVKTNKAKNKPVKDPLAVNFYDIKEDFFEKYHKRMIFTYSRKFDKESERIKELYRSNELNIGLMLKFSDLVVIDVDNADYTLARLNKIISETSEENSIKLKEFLEVLKETFTVTSGNGGFHHYFRLKNKQSSKYNTRKTKAFSVAKFLQIKEPEKLDIDILGTGYVMTPPDKFFFKNNAGEYVNNEYFVSNDSEIQSIAEDILDFVFDVDHLSKENKSEKHDNLQRKLNKEKEGEKEKLLKRLLVADINSIYLQNDLMKIISERDWLFEKIIKSYNISKDDRYIQPFLKRKEAFHQNLTWDLLPYVYFLDMQSKEYEACNSYKILQKAYQYSDTSRVFSQLKEEKYALDDRSRLEFSYLIQQKKIGINDDLIKTRVEKTFSKNTKFKTDDGFLESSLEKVNGLITSNELQENKEDIYHILTNFLVTAQKIDYPYYFKGSASSCSKLFIEIVNRIMKQASKNNKYTKKIKNNYELTYENLTSVSHFCGLTKMTTSRILEKLIEKQFFTVEYFDPIEVEAEVEAEENVTELSEDDLLFLEKIEPILAEERNFEEPKLEEKIKRRKRKYFKSILINPKMQFKMLENVDDRLDVRYDFELLPEMGQLIGIKRIGSILFTKLCFYDSLSIKEIYKLFPQINNKYVTIKNKLNKHLELGFIVYTNGRYKASTENLYTKMKFAKKKEHEIRLAKFYKIDEVTRRRDNKRKPKPKPFFTTEFRVKQNIQSKIDWDNETKLIDEFRRDELLKERDALSNDLKSMSKWSLERVGNIHKNRIKEIDEALLKTAV